MFTDLRQAGDHGLGTEALKQHMSHQASLCDGKENLLKVPNRSNWRGIDHTSKQSASQQHTMNEDNGQLHVCRRQQKSKPKHLLAESTHLSFPREEKMLWKEMTEDAKAK